MQKKKPTPEWLVMTPEAAYAKLPPLEDVPLEDIVHVSEQKDLVWGASKLEEIE